MAALLYYPTIADWKNDGLGGNTDPVARLLLENLNQLYSGSMTSGAIALTFTTDGTATYVNAALIGKTISAIFISSMLQTSEYSFDNTTGTITWTVAPDTGIDGAILYS